MIKNTILFLFITMLSVTARAQTAESVFEQYLDFNYARLQGEADNALTIGENVLPQVKLLPEKSRVSFYNGLAKLYEDAGQPGKAIPYYEIVERAQPTYYVVHRALGYLYLLPATDLFTKLNAASGKTEKDMLTSQYKAIVQKALPHLEKAQACDPSDETLALIKSLYTNIKDDAGLKGLDERLKTLSKNCLDILNDQ